MFSRTVMRSMRASCIALCCRVKSDTMSNRRCCVWGRGGVGTRTSPPQTNPRVAGTGFAGVFLGGGGGEGPPPSQPASHRPAREACVEPRRDQSPFKPLPLLSLAFSLFPIFLVLRLKN